MCVCVYNYNFNVDQRTRGNISTGQKRGNDGRKIHTFIGINE